MTNTRTNLLLQRSLLVLLFLAPVVEAEASIEYSDAELVTLEERLHLDADGSIELNQSIETGLASGVPLFFNTTFTIEKINPWWFDTVVHSQVFRYSLVYYELTRHYRVSWLHESRSRNFRSLIDALDSIATLRNMPLEISNEVVNDKPYQATLRLALDQNALPLALRPVAFVNSAWRLRTEEYRWQIN